MKKIMKTNRRQIGRIRLIGRIGLICLITTTCAQTAHALDWHATPESVWAEYVTYPPPAPLTQSRLRLGLELSALGKPLPSFPSATPHGIRLQYWDRVIGQHGLAAVADDYISFLRKLKADLERENKPANNQK